MGNNNIVSKYKDLLIKNGYVVIRNFFNEQESEELKKKIYNVHKSQLNASEIHGMHKHKEYWDLICNKKIVDTMSGILGEKMYYLYNSNTKTTTDKVDINSYSWHRDSACRQFGFGPDWNNKDEIYNVFRVGIYLFDSHDIKSGLNIIPNSHKTKYSLSNFLRILHYKLRNKKNRYIQFFRSVLSRFIGCDIKTNNGDIVIFLANLMHSEIPAKKFGRVTAFLSYGPNNNHSKNYVNYYMMHRKGYDMNMSDEHGNQFSELLKNKDIFFPPPKIKDSVKGFSVPLADRY